MASKDQLRDEVRRTTLRDFPLPTAAEGAGRLFDWMDDLSLSYYRAIMRPDADAAALAADFGAVGLDLDVCLEYLRRNPEALQEDPVFWASMISRAFDQRTQHVPQPSRAFGLRRLLRKIHAQSMETAGQQRKDPRR